MLSERIFSKKCNSDGKFVLFAYFSVVLFAFSFLSIEKSFAQAADTLSESILIENNGNDSARTKIHPGDSPIDIFTPKQDTAWAKAMSLKIPEHSRFQNDLRFFFDEWFADIESENESPWAAAKRNMDISSKTLEPRGEEVVAMIENIDRAFAVPGMTPFSAQKNGLSIPLSSIGSFLGVTEDVSPDIKYSVEFTSKVEILIYSLSAKVIATVYNGVEQPGSYKKTWNLRDEFGRPVPRGDYVAEVRIGDRQLITKRIYVGFSKYRQ